MDLVQLSLVVGVSAQRRLKNHPPTAKPRLLDSNHPILSPAKHKRSDFRALLTLPGIPLTEPMAPAAYPENSQPGLACSSGVWAWPFGTGFVATLICVCTG
jgi:hypothetical protein